MPPKQKPFKNLHLLVSVLLILVIAVLYGFAPEKLVPTLSHLETGHADISSTFKAIMGLYLGMAILWIVGIKRPGFWYAATIVNITFMLGLALGRVISIAVDGFPGQGMLFGLVLELSLGLWGILSLRAYTRFEAV